MDEAALVTALSAGLIVGAGFNGLREEPLAVGFAYVDLSNAILPQSSSETWRYATAVIDRLLEILDGFAPGEALRSGI